MIKKYNRILVNISALTGDTLSVPILLLPCGQGPLCLPLSSAVMWNDVWISVLFTIFSFSLALQAGALLCSSLNQSRKLQPKGAGSLWVQSELDKEEDGRNSIHEVAAVRMAHVLHISDWLLWECLVFSKSLILAPCPAFSQAIKGPGEMETEPRPSVQPPDGLDPWLSSDLNHYHAL